ncbi:MAG: hypothetical protein A3H45_15710 [Ignavibacteria bacterium RIFCSPLOWO2_02_FULL_55_14]|nr:MAG: hypothetical protein A3H45_15710 [Ignavibacteria bacterium RIFCSPLOWO2_02_FULL_55_14]
MRLPSFLRRHRLSPAWSYTPGGVIWRLLVSGDGHIVGEDRDTERKTVRFFCVDGRSGKVLWSNLVFEEQWWVGIEAVHGAVVLIHEFATPDMPDHLGIRAVDIETGRVLWGRRDATYSFAYKDRLYAVRAGSDSRTFIALDVMSGEVVEEFPKGDDTILPLRSLAVSEVVEGAVEHPHPIGPAEHVDAEAELPMHPKGAVGDVEMLQVGDRSVVGWYVTAPFRGDAPRFHQHLVVYSKDRSVEFEALVHDDAKAPLPDTFFAHSGILYFITQDRTLNAMPLSRTQ